MNFIFNGTKRELLNRYQDAVMQYNLKYPEKTQELIVYIEDEVIYIGVESGNHASGGYWFSSRLTEKEGSVVLCGKISQAEPKDNLGIKILVGMMYVFAFPLLFATWLIFWDFPILYPILRKKRLERYLCEFLGCKLIKNR